MTSWQSGPGVNEPEGQNFLYVRRKIWRELAASSTSFASYSFKAASTATEKALQHAG